MGAVEGPLATARLADRLLLLGEEEQRARRLVKLVWGNLQRLSVNELQAELDVANEAHWRGWLELALLAADVMESPQFQATRIALWQERYPLHRASANLPGGLDSLAESALAPPGRLGLLLPLSAGPTADGRAALEGFLAARYLAQQRGWPEQQLMIMDSGAFSDLGTAYADAVRAGADIVIGPLTPELASGWRAGAESSVPLLMLTTLPDSAAVQYPPPQLNLHAEDEARKLAQLAFDRGARNALVVRPVGAWGDRVSSALIEAWQQLEGEVRAIATYSGQSDYSSSLKSALMLADSEARAARVRRLLAEPTEFTPRRRQDLDVIFLLSDETQQARSLKPLLAFHYAGDLPVYSTSAVFSGRRDPQRDRDLNGVHLVETPWSLQPGDPLPSLLLESGAEGEMADMHALGADAFMLNWRLQQLRQSPDALIRGQTGLLRMDASGRIHRELSPAIFRGGVPTPGR